jgi:hypothetical protein
MVMTCLILPKFDIVSAGAAIEEGGKPNIVAIFPLE